MKFTPFEESTTKIVLVFRLREIVLEHDHVIRLLVIEVEIPYEAKRTL